jgi:hypothetical protein
MKRSIEYKDFYENELTDRSSNLHLFEKLGISKQESKIPFDLYVGPDLKTKHNRPRLKAYQGEKAWSITTDDKIEIIAGGNPIKSRDWKLLVGWIEKHKDVINKLWNKEITQIDAAIALKGKM